MKDYNIYYNPNPFKLEVSDCAARAICKAFNYEWKEAVMELTQIGLEMGRMCNDNKTIEEFCTRKGAIRHKVTVKKGSKRPTANSLCSSTENKGKTFLCSVAGHVVTVYDRHYYDTWESGNKGIYWYYEIPEEIKNK